MRVQPPRPALVLLIAALATSFVAIGRFVQLALRPTAATVLAGFRPVRDDARAIVVEGDQLVVFTAEDTWRIDERLAMKRETWGTATLDGRAIDWVWRNDAPVRAMYELEVGPFTAKLRGLTTREVERCPADVCLLDHLLAPLDVRRSDAGTVTTAPGRRLTVRNEEGVLRVSSDGVGFHAVASVRWGNEFVALPTRSGWVLMNPHGLRQVVRLDHEGRRVGAPDVLESVATLSSAPETAAGAALAGVSLLTLATLLLAFATVRRLGRVDRELVFGTLKLPPAAVCMDALGDAAELHVGARRLSLPRGLRRDGPQRGAILDGTPIYLAGRIEDDGAAPYRANARARLVPSETRFRRGTREGLVASAWQRVGWAAFVHAAFGCALLLAHVMRLGN